jgi:hypothetical protein
VAYLACGSIGCTWYFEQSIERVVYRSPGGKERVLYKNNYYDLHSAERMAAIVEAQILADGAVHVGGKYLSSIEADQKYVSYPFIDVSTSEERETYERLQSRAV